MDSVRSQDGAIIPPPLSPLPLIPPATYFYPPLSVSSPPPSATTSAFQPLPCGAAVGLPANVFVKYFTFLTFRMAPISLVISLRITEETVRVAGRVFHCPQLPVLCYYHRDSCSPPPGCGFPGRHLAGAPLGLSLEQVVLQESCCPPILAA